MYVEKIGSAMGLDDQLRELAEARNTEDPLKIGLNSLIASLYNLSRVPMHIDSGISEHYKGRMRMLGKLRDMVIEHRGIETDLSDAMCLAGNDRYKVNYGDVLELFETAQVSTEEVSQWVEEMLCIADHEYAAVQAGYPHLVQILGFAREQWCLRFNDRE